MSGRGAGGFTGALVGGVIVDRYSNSLDLVMALCEMAAAMAIASLPFSASINTVWLHYFTLGFTGAMINMGRKTIDDPSVVSF